MMRFNRLMSWVVLAGFIFGVAGVARAADESAGRAVALLPEAYRADVTRALGEAGKNQAELIGAIEGVKAEQRVGVAFLIANMPLRDLTSLSKDFLVENVTLAYAAREASDWAKADPSALLAIIGVPTEN